MTRNEDKWRDLWDSIKSMNIRIIGVEEREKGPEEIFEETIFENFPNMGKGIVSQVQQAQKVPGRINPRRNTPRHIVTKLTKIKGRDKMLKATKEKWQIIYRGTPTILSADFSTETLQVRREWHDILQVMKGKNRQPRILYPARLSFRFDGEIKSFPDKQKLIQHHQTSFTTNAKGTSLGRKQKEKTYRK